MILRWVSGLLILAAPLFPARTLAQTPGGTDIYLAPLETVEGVFHVGDPVNITRREGYDNQPFFSSDGSLLLFTSIREGQADTYQYDLSRKKVVQVTRTEESEYSPTPLPRSTDFSVIQVEPDSSQRLWAFSQDGKGARLLLATVEPVGYHAWGNENLVALFVLGEPHTLQLVDLRQGKPIMIAEDIGRSLHKIPDRPAISFMQRTGEDIWWIKELRINSRRTVPLVKALPQSQDYVWTPEGCLLMARESRLFACWPDSTDWEQVADFGDQGLVGITRLAVSPWGDWLALVADRPARDED